MQFQEQTTDFHQEAKTAARSRIAEIFNHPDDLANNFASFSKKLSSEKSLVETQLNAAAMLQYDQAQQGLDALAFAKSTSLVVRKNLIEIDRLCSDAQSSIKNYDKIKIISSTHQNMSTTKEMVLQFQHLNSQIDRVKTLLYQDHKNLKCPHENILFIHYQIFVWEEFRNVTLQKAKSSPSDILNTLTKYFRRIDLLITEFEDYLWHIARNTLELIKNKNTPAVVRMVKIIELEEKADEDAALASNESYTTTITNRGIKSYRIKFFDVIREGIAKHFKDLYEKNVGDISKMLQGVDLVVDDLILVYDELVPCFPPRYNIFQFFVLEYHRIIYETVNKITQKSMEGGAILLLLKWVRDYYQSMNGRLGVGEELLEPRLLDGREEELMVAYVKLVKGKLNEWLTNLLDSETRDFIKRDSPPEGDAAGLYILSGSVIQIDVVTDSSRGPLLLSVVNECILTLDIFKSNWIKVIESEFKKFKTKPTEFNEGFPEYLMALANDCYRSTEFSETMITRLETVLDLPWLTTAIEKVRESSNGFLKVAKIAYGNLIEFPISDTKRALVLMYCPQWYDQELMRMIIGTFEDYLTDYQLHLSEYLFTKLTSDCLDKFAVVYIECFTNKAGKFKMPLALDKMKCDLEMATTFFTKFKPAKKVKSVFDPIEKIIAFLEASPDLAFLDFYTLWKSYPDVSLTFIEDILLKRDDVTKVQAKEIMEACTLKVKDDVRIGEITPTVFSKLHK